MSDGERTRDSSRDTELQDEFVHAALTREQGVHPRLSVTRVHIRIGRRFISVWWLLPIAVVGAGILVAAAKIFASSGTGKDFLASYPCVPTSPGVAAGMPAFVIVTHFLNFFFMILIIRAGWQILADHPRLYTKLHCTPDSEWLRFRGPIPKDRVWTAKDDAITLSPLVGLPGGRHTIGVARHWHFLFDIAFVLNGIAFVALLFATGRWERLVPVEWSIFPDAASCFVSYASLAIPNEPGGYFRYDALQQLSYFGVIFVLAPLAILSGLAMSPALDNRFKWYQRLFGNRQTARTVHFLVMLTFVLFYAAHMVMVAALGFSTNLNAITLGTNDFNLNGVALLVLALAVTLGFNLWAVRFSWTHTRVLQRISNATVGRVMDLLFDHMAPQVQYGKEDISPYFWPNGLVPTSGDGRPCTTAASASTG